MDADSIIGDITAVTKKWTRQRRAEERHANARRRRATIYTQKDTVKAAAAEVMEAAYLKASGNGAYPAHDRQIMYAARDHIQDATGKPLDDKYFTQTLLPDYMNDNPGKTAGWDVVFDARGHLVEPHTRTKVPLGTIDVRNYLGGGNRRDGPARVRGLFPTHGPANRFGAILFLEKEGFMPLFRRARLAETYDIAIMSTKGMSVVAARMLVDSLCGTFGIPLFVLHDLDKSGFSILGSLTRSNRRYQFRNHVKVIDLGLRLADVQQHGLGSESSYITDTPKARANLRRNGATPAEIDFILGGERVELNAFTSPDFLAFIKGGLKRHGVKKVVPAGDVLAAAFARAFVRARIRAAIPELTEEANRLLAADNGGVPEDLVRRVTDMLKKKEYRDESWDRIIARLARQAAREADDGPDSAR
jgi:hypothetical protein